MGRQLEALLTRYQTKTVKTMKPPLEKSDGSNQELLEAPMTYSGFLMTAMAIFFHLTEKCTPIQDG